MYIAIAIPSKEGDVSVRKCKAAVSEFEREKTMFFKANKCGMVVSNKTLMVLAPITFRKAETAAVRRAHYSGKPNDVVE